MPHRSLTLDFHTANADHGKPRTQRPLASSSWLWLLTLVANNSVRIIVVSTGGAVPIALTHTAFASSSFFALGRLRIALGTGTFVASRLACVIVVCTLSTDPVSLTHASMRNLCPLRDTTLVAVRFAGIVVVFA